ncbi:MAG: hypothetical protein WA126_07140 [Thermodesulfovibrionales bacterium]
MSFEIPVPLGLTIIAIVIFVVWQFYKRKIQRINQMPDIPLTISTKGFEVPILAAFTGLKRLPRQISFFYNNINPSLSLFEDRLECRDTHPADFCGANISTAILHFSSSISFAEL